MSCIKRVLVFTIKQLSFWGTIIHNQYYFMATELEKFVILNDTMHRSQDNEILLRNPE